MKTEFKGHIAKILKLQTFDSGFKKQDLILDLDQGSKYENVVKITFMKDKTDLLDGLKEGDYLNVWAWIGGRSYLKEGEPESKRMYFNEIKGDSLTSANKVNEAVEEVEIIDDPDSGDLPF